jgi:hypothetical protein
MLTQILRINSAPELELLIVDNQKEFFDYFSLTNHAEFVEQKDLFNQVSLKLPLFRELDYSNQAIAAFIDLILTTAIRIGDMFVFEGFYAILRIKNLEISNLIEASSLFMIDVNQSQDFFNRYDEIIEKLEVFHTTESDNEKDSVAGLICFYSVFVKQFSQFAQQEVERMRLRIAHTYAEGVNSFLEDNIINEICRVTTNHESNPFRVIQETLDRFIGRAKQLPVAKAGFLVEVGTAYVDLITNTNGSFDEIQAVNSKLYSEVRDDSIHRSLRQGVEILTTNEQLYCYMYSYGKMHRAKLRDAITALPSNVGDHQVVDWACGQGIGSLIYLEHLTETSRLSECKYVTLIEPSEPAIKRAAFHVTDKTKNLLTVNKDFDSLSNSDFEKDSSLASIHVFSNILDMQFYSLSALISLISSQFKGRNYFIISSPYISPTRTARIDSFVNNFRSESGFEQLLEVNNRKGSWDNGWSRALRVFAVDIA